MTEEKKQGKLKRLLRSQSVHNFTVFLLFVFVSAALWFVMALNDNVQDSVEVRVNIFNIPDSVTFINEPPSEVHISLRDRGSSLLRNARFHTPAININFLDYSKNGVFRFTRNDIQAALKATFGAQATILSTSIDSIRCEYTTLKGRRVPVQVSAEFEPTPGNVVKSELGIEPGSVVIYSASQALLDTVTRVFTQRLVRKGISETTNVEMMLRNIPGARIIPNKVMVRVPVEPLVSKESVVSVKAVNVPDGEDIVIFPSRVGVSYYTPMSKYNDKDPGIQVSVDYEDVKRYGTGKIPVRITYIPNGISDAKVLVDSVEYSLVK